MNWLSLSPVEIAAAWAVLGAAALWLYLHHRRPQRRKVSTLRFWASVQAVSQPRRRKVREPWALIAQILFLLLILLALANPRWGITTAGRSVVMILDTSIWSQAHPSGESAWIDQERTEALRVIDSLPASDRVLLLRAEGDAPPIVPFTTDHAELRRAISNVRTSGSAADIPRALEMARAAIAGSSRSLLVYVGPGMLSDDQARSLDEFRASIATPDQYGNQSQFLVRLAGDGTTLDNRGITRLSLRRDAAQPDRWHLLTQLKNYSASKANVVLKLSVNGESLGEHNIALTPNELANTDNEFVWDKGGYLQAEISPPDALEADNRAVVNLPTFRTIHVAMYVGGNSDFATNLLSVLSSNPYLETQIVLPGMPLRSLPDVAIYQGTSLPAEPAFNSIFFLAGPASSASRSVRVTQWNRQHPVTRWVRTHDISVRNPATLTALPTDAVLAYTDETPAKPLILAREQNGHRLLIVGFDPHNSNFPMESAFPLLMAGGMEWMTHSVDEAADSVSTGELDLPGPVTRVVAPSGRDVQFARTGAGVHLLALETGMYRVITASGETSIAINTPLLPAQRLNATSAETASVESEPRQIIGADLWRWPVLFAIVVLWLEWWLYYSARERQRTVELPETPGDASLQFLDGELDEREELDSRKPNFVAR
jgi:Ca-activated chloride channel homolog